MPTWDLVVVGEEVEGCLAALAAARMGLKVLQLRRPGRSLGGLLVEGLAYVDRDARHLEAPRAGGPDGLMGEFLAHARVPLVALRPETGVASLNGLLHAAGVHVIKGRWQVPEGLPAGGRLEALPLQDDDALDSRFFLDATPDGDLAEALGQSFAVGFQEYGLNAFLGVSPLPEVLGVPVAELQTWAESLCQDPQWEALKQEKFPGRTFLALEPGPDHLLIGPPHLALAYQSWRESQGFTCPWRFEADGFNVAVLGSDRSSWNGLMYFSESIDELLAWSRQGPCQGMQEEGERFVRFLREVGGFQRARLAPHMGMYVRQTRHALGTHERIALAHWGQGPSEQRAGRFSYYPDFRGFRAVKVPGPLTVPILPGAAWSGHVSNLALCTRAAGYTPFAHSIGRLVQAGVQLGCAVAAGLAIAPDAPWSAPGHALREALAQVGAAADDPTGMDANGPILQALAADEVLAREMQALA